MKTRIFCIIFVAMTVGYSYAQDNKNSLPDLQTSESVFFDPTRKTEMKEEYKFSAPWRFEIGYAQFNHRTQDTTALYLHGLRVGATVDFTLPHHFSIQTGALATFTYGQDNQHWPSMDEESAQINILKHNLLQLQLTIPARAYYYINVWKKLNMFFFAGPQLQIGLTHYDVVNDDHISNLTVQWLAEQGIKTTHHDRYIDKQLYRTNIQFGLGGGIEWDRYRLQAGYDFGLNNIQRSSVLSHKLNEWGWMATFSYQL